MFAPNHTLLINTPTMLARIDLTGKRRLRIQNVWSRPTNPALSAVAVVATALKMGPRRAGRVWVLSTDFWTERVSLPADLCVMVSGEELQQALALEAEAASGIPAFDSRLAAMSSQGQAQSQDASGISPPLSGEGTWWVTQVPTADIQQMSESLRACRARFVGLAHPSAAYLASAFASGNSGGAVAAAHSQSTVATWCEQTPAMQVDGNTDSVESAAAWQQLVDQWTPYLVRGPARLPLAIPAAGQPLSRAGQLAIGGGLAVLTACGCAAAHVRARYQIERADRNIAQLEERQAAQAKTLAALKSAESRLALLRQEFSQIDSQSQKLQRDLTIAEATHAQQSLRWVALLDALAQSSDTDCWLQRLEATPARAILSGLAIDNSAAHLFASGLERLLGDSGWIVQPAETKLDGRDLMAFKIVLDAKFTPVGVNSGSNLSQLKASEKQADEHFGSLAAAAARRDQ